MYRCFSSFDLHSRKLLVAILLCSPQQHLFKAPLVKGMLALGLVALTIALLKRSTTVLVCLSGATNA